LKTLEEYLEGQVILINKPLTWTSFQAVNKLKFLLRKKLDLKKFKIGHAGTLDPLATGLLVICTGKFTKKITEIQIQPKEYLGIITLGSTTPSYDLETEINQIYEINHITNTMILDCAKSFEGEIMQKPPIYSALKKEGVRLYELARNNETVEITARPTTIYSFKISKIEMPNVHFIINCSKGTYIRSIAYDFGITLHSGAHLSALTRTKIGDYSIENAISPDEFEKKLFP
jgi:tRNA pseudouridine55 synthase